MFLTWKNFLNVTFTLQYSKLLHGDMDIMLCSQKVTLYLFIPKITQCMFLYDIQTEQKLFMNHSHINCHIHLNVAHWILCVLLILRLIYWVCVALGSSVRALGFTLSFLPLLVLLGANLYFIGSVRGQEAVFDVAPPTTAPPPKPRWWGWTQWHVQHLNNQNDHLNKCGCDFAADVHLRPARQSNNEDWKTVGESVSKDSLLHWNSICVMRLNLFNCCKPWWFGLSGSDLNVYSVSRWVTLTNPVMITFYLEIKRKKWQLEAFLYNAL